ncbi:PAS domain-containing sensor histidine kinase [Variovorax saccharolyticus]|uniref:PAS domain-containing sensor histidine kinase n=1 Tax=Variovorax saccharolyticus TaxID=3053516 RepID=UPI002575504E|nr:HAMP domain-containing sensor histidine kinase [Variovorax sp. J31P216]MDM0028879.1 HAMP domain-containing sensor histidine kinase [Variovorax sp. J31P216]
MRGSPNDPLRTPGITPERALELLWQQAPDVAFVLLDSTGRITGWRGAAEAMLGHAEDEVIGQPLDIIFAPEDLALGLADMERTVALAMGHSEDDRWHLRKDGTRIWVAGSLVALHEGDRHVGYAKIMCDRTNLRAQMETTENRLDHAHDALRGRDVFFGRLTHEVRNALGPIRSVTDVVERRGLVTAELTMPLQVVKRQVAQMERMMEDLAEVARFGAGKLQLAKTAFDLGVDLREIAAAVTPDAKAKLQTLEVLTPQAPIRLDADQARVHQIVFNLLHNAVKYTPRGGRIWLHCTVEIDQAVIKVSDDGQGIPSELLPVIFELFTQENPHQAEGGFGVGLSLVKDLVDAHQGFVEVRSDGKGRGSEFTVRLPLRAPSAEGASGP